MRFVSAIVFVALISAGAWGQTNYYSAGNDDITSVNSWWTNADGTGSHPADFTSPNQIFRVQSGHVMNTSSLWTVSGDGSRVVIETGGKIVTGQFNHSITLDMQSGAEYSIGNATYGEVTVGTWDNNSTIRFTVPPSNFRTINHPNVIMDFSKTKSLSASLTVLGDFTLQNGGTFNVAGTSVAGRLNIGGALIVSSGTFSTGNASGILNFTNTGKASGSITVTSGTLILGIGTADTINIASGRTVGLGNDISIDSGSAFIVNGVLSSGSRVITGTGGFVVAAGASFITGHTGGVYGTVQTSSTSFSSTANYTFDGTSAQITSVGMPSTVSNLTINNSAGVTLSQSTTASMLFLTNGTLATGANTLAVSSGFSGYRSGKFVDGNLAVSVDSTGGYIFPLGQGSDYLPVTATFTSLAGSDNVTISAIDKSSTPPGGPLGSNRVLSRYFTFNKGSGITAFAADVSFSYSDADVASAGATESALKVFQWDGAQWHPLATTIDTTANTADVSGLTSFSEFVLSGTFDTPLPVTMKGSTAIVDAGKVKLIFATTTEIGVVGFTVSRAPAKAGPFQVVSSYSSNAALKAVGSTTTGGSYEFVDSRVIPGQTYYYMIEAVGKTGTSDQVGNLMEVQVTARKDFAVYQNYPNPFNPSTTIRYDLKEQSNVRLEVYNVLGMKVRSENFQKDAGTFEARLDFSQMPSGIYYFRMVISGKSGSSFVSTKKALLMK